MLILNTLSMYRRSEPILIDNQTLNIYSTTSFTFLMYRMKIHNIKKAYKNVSFLYSPKLIRSHSSIIIASTGHSSAACLQASSISAGTSSTFVTAKSSSISKTSGHIYVHNSQPVQRSGSTFVFISTLPQTMFHLLYLYLLSSVSICALFGLRIILQNKHTLSYINQIKGVSVIFNCL